MPASSDPVSSWVRVDAVAMAVGGDAIGRVDGGRVVFISGAISGETVDVEFVSRGRDFDRARTREVVRVSPDRRSPPCSRVAEGCGGCQWQHIDPTSQRALKVGIVRDAMRRIGKFREHDDRVRPGPVLNPTGYRTTVRAVIGAGGRAGFRVAHSHDVCISGPCLVAHPVIARVLEEGRFTGANEVVVRYAESTQQLAVLPVPPESRVSLPPDLMSRMTADGTVTEQILGHDFRVSPSSFFQARPDGAAALCEEVAVALGVDRSGRAGGGHWSPGPLRLIDLYGGVGLFAATLADLAPWAEIVTVERNPAASADAEQNLVRWAQTVVVNAEVDDWRPTEFAGSTFVVADPARAGLGRAGVATIARTRAERVALVSCDPAAFARDAALLVANGYVFVHATTIDLFAHTHHIEIVSRFDQVGPVA